MTDRVYPAVQGLQSSPLKPDVDRTTTDPGAKELGPGYNPMLSPPKLSQELVDATLSVMRPAFATYCVVNAGRVN